MNENIITRKDAVKLKLELCTEDVYNNRKEEAIQKLEQFISTESWMKTIQWKCKEISVAVAKDAINDLFVIKKYYKYDEFNHTGYTSPFAIIESQQNLDALFKYHPMLNKFKQNTFTEEELFDEDVFDRDKKPSEIYNFFRRVFDWCPRQDINDTIQETLNRNSFNPVIEYFDNLLWDGVERLETFMIDYYGAEDTPLNRVYFKRWMNALVKRVYEPGCKFDNMLILHGKQGKYKSTLFEWLGKLNNEIYYAKTPSNLKDSQDIVYATKGVYLSLNDDFDDICDKGNIGLIKAFITAQSDTAALKFKHAKQYPRHYVFGATTNSRSFLSDDAAEVERRFWIISVNPSGLVQTLSDELKDNLFAEAIYLYKKDPNRKLWIHEPELVEEEKKLQSTFKNATYDPISDVIVDIFTRPCSDDGIIKSEESFKSFCKNNQYLDVNDLNKLKPLSVIPVGWVNRYLSEEYKSPRCNDRIIRILEPLGVNIVVQPRYRFNGKQTTCFIVYRTNEQIKIDF